MSISFLISNAKSIENVPLNLDLVGIDDDGDVLIDESTGRVRSPKNTVFLKILYINADNAFKGHSGTFGAAQANKTTLRHLA